jgi:hypothetical protein
MIIITIYFGTLYYVKFTEELVMKLGYLNQEALISCQSQCQKFISSHFSDCPYSLSPMSDEFESLSTKQNPTALISQPMQSFEFIKLTNTIEMDVSQKISKIDAYQDQMRLS